MFRLFEAGSKKVKIFQYLILHTHTTIIHKHTPNTTNSPLFHITTDFQVQLVQVVGWAKKHVKKLFSTMINFNRHDIYTIVFNTINQKNNDESIQVQKNKQNLLSYLG